MSDHAHRALALDPRQSFIVQAPAGSGKTELLTQRFLKLLAYQDAPEEILAVTFTRKAASQMRQRILSALKDASVRKEPPLLPHESKTWELAKEVLNVSQKKQWALIQNPNRLRIVTIDALCAYIVNRMPILSHLGSAPEILDYPEKCYQQAVTMLLKETSLQEKWTESLRQLLLHLDNKMETIMGLLVTLLSKRDQWLPYLSQMHGEDIDLKNYMNVCLKRVIQSHFDRLRSKFGETSRMQLASLLNYAATACQKQGIESAMNVCQGMQDLPKADLSHRLQWEAITELLTTQKKEWRKSFTQKNGFPSPSEAKDKIEKSQRKAQKENISALIESFSEDAELLALLAETKHLPPSELSEQQLTILNALSELLPILVAFLQLVFQEEGKVDFIEVILRGLSALGDELEPTEIALALDYQIKHILIDEYQDTSVIQYRLFEKLVVGWQKGDGRTLFLVGDPMQSIYRFRGAEVSLFMHTAQYGLGEVSLTPLTLNVNFRSTSSIIAWVNNTFTDIFPKKAERSLGGVPYAPAIAQSEKHAGEKAVCIHALEKGKDNLATCVLNLIQTFKAKHPEKSIAVLVRAKKHLITIIQSLKKNHIAFVAHEVEHLAERSHVIDLISLLRAMDLTDEIAWYAILRAPWLGLSLSDIWIISQAREGRLIWEVLDQGYSLDKISVEGEKRLQAFIPIMRQWLRERHRHQLSHWLRGIWIALGGPACYAEPYFIKDIDKILELVENLSKGGKMFNMAILESKLSELYGDISFLVDSTEEKHANGKVELMTIHKSKGLEFDMVIMPHLQMRTVNHERSLLLWFERSYEKGIDLILAPSRSQQEESDALYQYVAKQMRQKSAFETARLLYVGVTRAKTTLHLVAECEIHEDELKEPPSGSFLKMLWPHVQAEMTTSWKQACYAEVSVSKQKNREIKRLKLGWQLPEVIQNKLAQYTEPLEAEDLNIPESTDNIFRSAGTVFHRMLHRWAFNLNASRSLANDLVIPEHAEKACSNALKRMGLSGSALKQATGWVIQGLQNMLVCPTGRWILDPSHLECQTEWHLSCRVGSEIENNVIDYAFIDREGTRWIVDYKLSNLSSSEKDLLMEQVAKYRSQLQKYQRMLSLLEDRPVRSLLYFPLAKFAWEL